MQIVLSVSYIIVVQFVFFRDISSKAFHGRVKKAQTGEGESKGKPSLSTQRSLCEGVVLTQPCAEQKRRSMCMWNVCLVSMWRFMGFSEGRGGQLRREWEVLSIITHPPHCHSLAYLWNWWLFVGFGIIVCVCGWLCILMPVVVFPQAWGLHVSGWKWQCCHGDSCIQFAAILFLLCFSQCVWERGLLLWIWNSRSVVTRQILVHLTHTHTYTSTACLCLASVWWDTGDKGPGDGIGNFT